MATQLDTFLGISFHDKDVPDESGRLPARQPSFAAIAPVAAIVVPDGALADAHYREAAEALAAACARERTARAGRGRALPAGRHGESDCETGAVVVGNDYCAKICDYGDPELQHVRR